MTNLTPDEIKKSLVSSLSNPDENISRAIMIPELDFSAFADPSGNVLKWGSAQ